MHITFAVRPGYFFVHPLLAPVGMSPIASGDEIADRTANPGRRVHFGPEVHVDLEFWRWFVDKDVDARGGVLSAPMYHLFERLAQCALFSNASRPPSADTVSKPVFTGATILPPRNRDGLVARKKVYQQRGRLIYQSG